MSNSTAGLFYFWQSPMMDFSREKKSITPRGSVESCPAGERTANAATHKTSRAERDERLPGTAIPGYI